MKILSELTRKTFGFPRVEKFIFLWLRSAASKNQTSRIAGQNTLPCNLFISFIIDDDGRIRLCRLQIGLCGLRPRLLCRLTRDHGLAVRTDQLLAIFVHSDKSI